MTTMDDAPYRAKLEYQKQQLTTGANQYPPTPRPTMIRWTGVAVKIIILLTLSAALYAAPIQFTESGSATQTAPDTFALRLYNGPWLDWEATLTSSKTLNSVTLAVDTLPAGVGTGLNISLDGEQVYSSPGGVLIQQTLTLSRLLGAGFNSIHFWTNPTGWIWYGENLTVRVEDLTKPPKEGSVPEPGSAVMMFLGFAALFGAPTFKRWLSRKGGR